MIRQISGAAALVLGSVGASLAAPTAHVANVVAKPQAPTVQKVQYYAPYGYYDYSWPYYGRPYYGYYTGYYGQPYYGYYNSWPSYGGWGYYDW